MVPYDMSCHILLPDEGGIGCDLPPNAEECGFYMVFFQDIEYLRCIIRIGTVVKGERDFRYGSITVE